MLYLYLKKADSFWTFLKGVYTYWKTVAKPNVKNHSSFHNCLLSRKQTVKLSFRWADIANEIDRPTLSPGDGSPRWPPEGSAPCSWGGDGSPGETHQTPPPGSHTQGLSHLRQVNLCRTSEKVLVPKSLPGLSPCKCRNKSVWRPENLGPPHPANRKFLTKRSVTSQARS